MKTLRQFLEAKDIEIYTTDAIAMAVKLGISLKEPINNHRANAINKIKFEIIITQFQIKFGLDEEF
jgi:hypothetical protein